MILKQNAWDWIDENREHLIEISDAIWGYAELGLMEHRSSKLLADELEKHGFRVERGVAGMPTAFVASWGSGKPVIGVMGEYDALPGISQKKVSKKDPLIEGAPGHGCGHNIHGVSGVAAAIAIRYALEELGLEGTVKFYGTPAEENYDGKVFMARAGLFDGVEACLSHHPGSINVAGLASSNAVNNVKFHFYGKTSHAAGSPEQGRSALDAVELMNIGVNFLREHIIEKARIHYVIEAGGGQPNVVPDYARSWYYVRAPERDQLEPIYKRILKIAEGAAMMTETNLEVEFLGGCYNKLPSRALSELVTANMREIGAPRYTGEELEFAGRIAKSFPKEQKRDALRNRKVPDWEKYVDIDLVTDILDAWDEGEVSAGSTDVSDVSWKTPTMEFSTTTFVLGAPGHSWQHVSCSGMSIGHKSLIFAAKTIAGTALDLMTKPELLKKAQDEFGKRMERRTYRCPIPDEIQPPLEVARVAAEAAEKRG
ncbi:MAG: M20 family metallopeptidase [Candidatus Bathyarchaeota archaeon]|nr:M20 family metallopeptidase [Candidatus Bathyarchaeota archaeon]MDH5790928.1 M20 family metallopeptidase [Candidatus Bathyarchaeota archaeon]